MNNIFINKKQWKQFNDKEMTEYQNSVFSYYRLKGFPYFPINHEYRLKELANFFKTDHKKMFINDVLNQHMAGLSFCWSFMPHSYSIHCGNKKTPLEVFNNDEDFKKVIAKRIAMGDNMSDNGIRKMLKIYTGTQCVSNFRPISAAGIYDYFAKNKIVWDMSGGFGGRMLGAVKAHVKEYIATEPSTKTYNGLKSMIAEFPELTCLTKIELYKQGSETLKLKKESVDFCFTSPPYFDTEKYSDEETQSYKKYPNKNDWLDYFLCETFKNCFYCLKNDGIMAINIANVKTYKNLEEDTIDVAQKVGFKLQGTLKYALSSLNKNNKYKYEPIFIFNKKW